MNKSSHFIKLKQSHHLEPSSKEVKFNQCCAFQNQHNDWKIVSVSPPKHTRKFLKLTINKKQVEQKTIKTVPSKQTQIQSKYQQSTIKIQPTLQSKPIFKLSLQSSNKSLQLLSSSHRQQLQSGRSSNKSLSQESKQSVIEIDQICELSSVHSQTTNMIDEFFHPQNRDGFQQLKHEFFSQLKSWNISNNNNKQSNSNSISSIDLDQLQKVERQKQLKKMDQQCDQHLKVDDDHLHSVRWNINESVEKMNSRNYQYSSQRKWIPMDLESISQVSLHFQTTQQLDSLNSSTLTYSSQQTPFQITQKTISQKQKSQFIFLQENQQ